MAFTDELRTVAEGEPPRRREAYRNRFLTSARYEYLFCDAAWEQEGWPI